MSSISKVVLLQRVAHALPLAHQTIYNRHRLGTLPWLTRIGPEGRRTRELWVNLDLLSTWANARGLTINIHAGGGTN